MVCRLPASGWTTVRDKENLCLSVTLAHSYTGVENIDMYNGFEGWGQFEWGWKGFDSLEAQR